MSDITKDEAERQKREAEQATAAAQAKAAQAKAEVARLKGIVEGIESLRPQAVDIMAVLQTARVRVETDACQVSTVLINLKAIQDKVVAIHNECQGHGAACEEAATKAKDCAERAERDANDATGRAQVADRVTDMVKVALGNAQDEVNRAKSEADAICNLRQKAERDAKMERTKSILGIILAVLALIVAVGSVVAFYHFSHIHSQQAVTAPVQPGQPPTPTPTVTPALTPAPFLTVNKVEFDQKCLANGLTAEQCAAAWDRYTK